MNFYDGFCSLLRLRDPGVIVSELRDTSAEADRADVAVLVKSALRRAFARAKEEAPCEQAGGLSNQPYPVKNPRGARSAKPATTGEKPSKTDNNQATTSKNRPYTCHDRLKTGRVFDGIALVGKTPGAQTKYLFMRRFLSCA